MEIQSALVGALVVSIPCRLILRSRGSLFVRARRMFRLALWVAVAAGVMYAVTAHAQTQPCAEPAQSNCALLVGYAVGEFVYSQTPNVWPQTVAIATSWAATQ